MRPSVVRTALVALVGALLLAGWTATPAPEEEVIRAARAAQNQAIATGALDSAATFWVSDVAITTSLGETLHGRGAYKEAFAHDAGFRYVRTTTRVSVSPNWPLAWEEGTWAGYPDAVSAPVIKGTYAAMWVKDAGRWRIRSELFVAMDCASAACRWPVHSSAP
jgi:ketosteroid isomerase-like protein